MSIKQEIRKILWKVGYDVFRFDPTSHYLARRQKFLELYAIDVILDVGANTGQYAKQMRKALGFSGRIISFEPLSSAFEQLTINANRDAKWDILNYALGSIDGQAEINISANSMSSSILNMLPTHIKAAPKSVYTGKETIEIRTLDSIMQSLCSFDENIFLKIDTQGFENEVIKGAQSSLTHIDTIQLEMALTPLYQDETLFMDIHSTLTEKGYSLVSIEPGFSDRQSARMLQIDGIYHRY